MTIEEIELIRLALDTPEHNKNYVKHTTEAKMILNKHEEAINYSQCCKSDSELLPSFLYKSEGGLYFKHREDTDVTDQWNEYLKTR